MKPSTAVLARSCLPSEPALGHLCTTQVLGVSAGKSPGTGLVTLGGPTGEDVAPKVPPGFLPSV